MGRLAILGVLLVALVVMTEGYRDYNQFGDGRRCQSSGRRVQSCQRYLQGGGQDQGGWGLPMQFPPQFGGGGSQDQSLGDCCRELNQVEHRCRCPAIEQALNEARRQQGQQGQWGGGWGGQWGGGWGGQQGYGGDESRDREMIQRAQNLPNICRLDGPQYCEIRAY